MSDLFGNHIVGFPTRRLICISLIQIETLATSFDSVNLFSRVRFEPPRGKTNNVVTEQVLLKPACTVTEAGKKLEILELGRGGIVLSE